MNLPMREYLNSKRPLLEEVVDWLCRNRIAKNEGVASLAHVMVVVPTAQSGRNLRLALAKASTKRGWGGILPPKVVQPMQLVKPSVEEWREATKAEQVALFLKFLDINPSKAVVTDMNSRLSLFDQLADIWNILAGGGLVMADVLKSKGAREMLEKVAGDEISRWEELTALEEAFFDFLHEHGICHPTEMVRLAKENPAMVGSEIKEVVLPALVDPIRVMKDVLLAQRPDLKITVLLHTEEDAEKFDEWGLPITEMWIGAHQPELPQFESSDIVLGADTSDMARRVVVDFPAVGSKLALPSLALVDDETFPEVASAFLNAGYVIHNPERHPLVISSLGRLIKVLMELYRLEIYGYAWSPFVHVLRSDDVLKAIVAETALNRADILQGLDFAQNCFLPQFLPRDCEFPAIAVSKHDQKAYAAFMEATKLLAAWLNEAREGHALTAFLRQMLRKIFAKRALTGADGEDEFREASSCVWEALDVLESEAIVGLELNDEAFGAVAKRVLEGAFYSLEPETIDAVKTEGWLELAWSAAEQFALVGFHEGSVPNSLVGHAFLPDGLRRALGLTNNDDRLARDTWLFKELLEAHGAHAVRAYVAKINNGGEICRPSRLLYLCSPIEFPKRVGYLFGECALEAERFPCQVVDRWRLRLPDEMALPSCDEKTPHGRLSASAIDQYIKCPFTYLLKYAMGMKPVEDKVELGYDDFGSLVHKVLEVYAKEQIGLGENQLTNVDQIRAALSRIVKEVTRTYGDHPSVNVALQLDALAGRMGLFAAIQAQWATKGWRIVERPEYPFLVQPFLSEGDDTWIKGSVDRIDYNPEFGYRIIDYKSWDLKTKVAGHIAHGGEAQTAFAMAQHFPLLEDGRRLMTIQLPLYALCLGEADAKFKGKIVDMCYLVLGEDEENTCVFGSSFAQGDFECQKRKKILLVETIDVALETARTAIRHIKENLFWPPGPGEEWQYDIKSLLISTPEKDMGAEEATKPEWLKKQIAKLEACK